MRRPQRPQRTSPCSSAVPFAGGAAALAAAASVGPQAVLGGKIVRPADVARGWSGRQTRHAVIGSRARAELPVRIDGLALTAAAADECAGVDRAGEQVVHGA